MSRAGRVVRPRRAARTRQERGLRTEAAILEATLRLLASRGIEGTSLDLVAEAVGVSKSSVLWHFGSKEELLLRVAERLLDEVAEGPVARILALPTLAERAEATWRFFTDTLRRRPELRRLIPYLVLESVDGRPELRARLQRLYRRIRELYASGLRQVVRDRERCERLAVISLAAQDGILLQWLLDPEAIDLDALEDELARLSGIGGRSPRRDEERAVGRSDDGEA